ERFANAAVALIVVNALVLTGPFALYFVIPYSTTLTVVAILAALVVITGNRFDWPVALALGTATAFAFAARYTDVVWVLALVAIPLWIRRREAWRVVVAIVGELAVAAAVVGWAQDRAFGSPFTTPLQIRAQRARRVVACIPAQPRRERGRRSVPHGRSLGPVS